MTHRITLLLEYTKLLETPQVKPADDNPETQDEIPADNENSASEELFDAAVSESTQETPAEKALTDEQPVSEKKKQPARRKSSGTSAKTDKGASKSTAKSTAKTTSKTTSGDISKQEETVKKPASERTAKKTSVKGKTAGIRNAALPADPDEALLKAVSDLLPRKGMEWSGTTTELLERLDGFRLTPNIAARKLNENADKLLSDYGISYERIRSHSSRLIKLTRVTAKNRRKSAKKKEGES